MRDAARRWGVVLSLALALPATAQDTSRVVRRRTAYDDLQMFSQVLNQIRTNHPDSLDTHDLMMAAMRAMVRAADPHSYVIPYQPVSAAKEAELASGKSAPVPVTFAFIEEGPVVTSVAPGSRARRSDILPGDLLVAIDGRPVLAESAGELDLVLRGPKGSEVTLTLARRRADGTQARVERAVRREAVGEATAVPLAMLLEPGLGYVRITTFDHPKVDTDLHEALGRLREQGMQRLVLDLRDNGGGLVDEAARVAGEFLPAGAVVYTASGRKAELVDTGRVRRSFWKAEQRYPIVVLVNEGTASASELVAGALQDHDRALIVGHPTFGKSLMMRGFPLSDGSVMMLVVGTIRTPCGRTVQRQYRGLSHSEYYRRAGAVRDTAGRPACTTSGGRRAFGGGGIYPDVLLGDGPASPPWLDATREAGVALLWAGGYAEGRLPSSLEAFASALALPPDAIASFRAAAQQRGVTVPDTPEVESRLRPELLRAMAYARWGEEGALRVEALLDEQVREARNLLGRAAALPGMAR